MAIFEKCLSKLWQVEFSNKVENMLHLVKGDTGGMTYCGISRKYHPSWSGWAVIDKVLYAKRDMKLASIALYSNKTILSAVNGFYRVEFWNPIHGDMLKYQSTATEIFLSGVNIGIRRAIRMAQEASGADIDGLFGHNTLVSINGATPKIFAEKYTALEVKYYEEIAEKGDNKKFLVGWIARAHAVDGENADKIV